MFDLVQGHDQHADAFSYFMSVHYSILAHPVVSVFCQLSPKQQKYQNIPYTTAVQKWLH